MTTKTPFLVISGPTGINKGRIEAHVVRRFPDRLMHATTLTTAPSVSGEPIEGFEHVEIETFSGLQRMLLTNDTVRGACYGTSDETLVRANASGRIPVIRLRQEVAVDLASKIGNPVRHIRIEEAPEGTPPDPVFRISPIGDHDGKLVLAHVVTMVNGSLEGVERAVEELLSTL